ncbi:MAG: exonuclease, partial [Pseudomonadota bacterium]
MTPGRVIANIFLAAGVALCAALLAVAAAVPGDAIALRGSLLVIAVIVVMLGAAMGLGRWLAAPVARLAGEVRLVADAKGANRIDPAAYRFLGALPPAIMELADEFLRARSVVDDAVAAATARAEEQKVRLEALLRDLSEGVIVCNLNHEILLYNHMAVRILGGAAEFGLGRTLFSFITREPVLHMLAWLTDQPDRGRSGAPGSAGAFVCATADARALLQGRMSLIVDGRNAVAGYVLTLADATQQIAALGKRDT